MRLCTGGNHQSISFHFTKKNHNFDHNETCKNVSLTTHHPDILWHILLIDYELTMYFKKNEHYTYNMKIHDRNLCKKNNKAL